ncbi:MAG: acyl-CoA reductase [Candidatus Eremiobacter antarcticus]|nr:hypothetical protein [Candidatus Eremiobacteraeota bacterium]MBC5807871.1 hypothetical protein [Candidatus Eremiobacteraeota bacterium]
MKLDTTMPVEPVPALLTRAAAAWSNANSAVRRQARTALAGGQWPRQTIETALDNALYDFEAAACRYRRQAAPPLAPPSALAILPGNIIGPAVACAFCAAVAGAKVVLKSSHAERRLPEILASQFDAFGEPFVDTVTATYWSGGDASREDAAFARADIIVVFGEDATIADVERRAPPRTVVRAYGNAYSIAYVSANAQLPQAADAAAQDIALFDQRGCMSPQTIYVQGDEPRCVAFAEALHAALTRLAERFPRAPADELEREAVAAALRRLAVAALPSGEGSGIFVGAAQRGAPSHVVAAQSFGKPVCMGFGRIAVAKPCLDAAQAASAASALGARFDTVAVAGDNHKELRSLFQAAGASRVCALGEMQRPPFGYRPTISDFTLPQ